MHSESKKTIYAAMAANFAIAVAKAVAGLIGRSPALLAEAAHSVADTMNQVFLLVSLSLGDRKPDDDPQRHLEGAPTAFTGGEAQGNDGRDGREERLLVAQQVRGKKVSDPRGSGRLDYKPAVGRQAPEPRC